MLVGDPCALTTEVVTAEPVVDVDRAPYGDGFNDRITFVFAGTREYDGGKVFDLADDAREFDRICGAGLFGLAATTVCAETGTALSCLHHVWRPEDPAAADDASA